MSLYEPQGLGAAFSIFLCSTGSAIASAEAGVYALRKHGYAAFVPIIISGVLAIYGIIISVLLAGKMETSDLAAADGYRNLSAGLSVGLACCASGFGIAKFLKHVNMTAAAATGETTPTSEMVQPLIGREYTPVLQDNFAYLTIVMTFLEAIGLYGLIAALFLIGK
jgi:V-type H+-transporting ATPase proteolipid subunit